MKKFQDLNLKDAFLFAAALEDSETCELVLELILGRKVGPVNVQVKRTLLYSSEYRYTFEERCKETDEPLGDGTYKIFLSTKGKNDTEIPKALVDFLRYVEDSTENCAKATDNVKIKQLDEKLKALKNSRRLEEKYMTLGEMLDDKFAEGRT